jgi:hypothetical protein
MTFKELQDAVAADVQDTSAVIVAKIPAAINEAVQQIAEEVILPSLKCVGTVTTSTSLAYVNIKSTIPLFSGKLRYVGTSDGRIKILDGGIEELLVAHPDMTEVGDIDCVAHEGDILWYAKIPSVAKTLTLLYQAVPATLVNDGDIPTDLPLYLHHGLIVNKTKAVLYDSIEDGIETPKTNTSAALALYSTFFIQLGTWVSRRRSNVGNSVWNV